MALVAVVPIFLKDCTLTIDADDFAAAASNVVFTPSQSTVEWRGLKPDAVFTDVSSETWTVQIDYAQDWTSPDSFSRYLFDHRGETVAMEFTPTDGVTPSFAADVVITSGAIGGAVGAFATSSVTLPVKGAPELVELGS